VLDPASIRFVYFDLDDTLLDHRAAERAALADCHLHYRGQMGGHQIEAVHEVYRAHNVPLWREYAAGRIGRADLQRLRFERLLLDLAADSVDPDAFGTHYMACYARHWRWMPGAEDAFQAIARHLPVGILTNGFSDVQHAKLDRFPILRERARCVVVSEEVGALKPDPRIFAHATAGANVPPEAVLYVGDSRHSDVDGGRAAGWQVAWLTSLRAEDVFCFSDWGHLVHKLTSDD
jgi:5'-nucleotidase